MNVVGGQRCMYNHAPEGYECPLCHVARGLDNDPPYTRRSDVVIRDEHVTAFVSSHWWPHNPGHVIVIPNSHVENIYDMSPDLLLAVHTAARQIAIAFKRVYQCDGTSTRQHNEPAGNQDVWHYHLHVFPRYASDDLYGSRRCITTVEERTPYAHRLRTYFENGEGNVI